MFPHPQTKGLLKEVTESILHQYGHSVILIPAEVDAVAAMIAGYVSRISRQISDAKQLDKSVNLEKIATFVRDVYGPNQGLADATLKEMGLI